jgi:hypothetical protein
MFTPRPYTRAERARSSSCARSTIEAVLATRHQRGRCGRKARHARRDGHNEHLRADGVAQYLEHVLRERGRPAHVEPVQARAARPGAQWQRTMGKRGRRSGANSAGRASSASNECPYRFWSSAGDGSLCSGLNLNAGFTLAANTWVGAGVADDFGSCTGALHVAAVVEIASADHVSRRERGSVELAGASGVDAAETAEMARTRAVRRRREEGAWVRDRFAVDTPAGLTSAATPLRLRTFCLARSWQFSLV